MALHTKSLADAADTSGARNTTPLLEAQGLTLRHSDATGISDISLSLYRGDIVGLLGLNGAGKSTTLRILCGVLVPDQGSVVINGQSMSDNPLQARAQVGFLPDQPPLYDDMRVCEYLTLTGRIRGLKGKRLKTRQLQLIEQCALGDVQRKIIGTLSKGFRQRVGLAQALIHEPAVVLLDEPANGLDPQQMDGMRKLISDIGQQQAILFSTHLLSEATAICNRVAIIHEGKLVADRPANGDDLQQIFQGAIS
ncbi:ABC transporter ATP-binding protein [Granulosicoccus antarcticus]|uniref:ABC transporter ATP-binding protein NatA n=1 Tax=Granulosicoccus antarcticus IMCC3135 TaxID=1192854 RepID=A0A2Z2NJA2_9GAMM|nr:ABC transporter ATP-binding protein [Granulosicoccus antarcticus]ASJ71173.1 ABC transporter ATP-binding protein NatA [Granulosicoccus antarcticus IMCC3135]